MLSNGFGGTGDFEGLARQYWSAWGEAMRQAGMGAAPAPQAGPNWQQAVDWWSQLLPGGHSQANDAVGRFNRQARDWYGQMQQVAAQFAGQENSAAEVGQAWRRALGANGDNPFPDLFKAMRGKGAHGLDEWLEQAQPYLDGFQQQAQRWQQMPAFGQYREHQERWQALQQAQQEYQQRSGEFNALMMQCAQDAFEVFEDKLTAHEEPGRQIASARALFDLWIDSAEQAYAQIALSQEFRERGGALTNAQMRLRAAIQREVEQMTGLFGIPTRTEIDSAHRKIAELERALRRAAAADRRPIAERKAAERTAAAAPVAAEPAAPKPVAKTKPRRAPRKQPAARERGARKPAQKQPAPRKAAVRKRMAKPATVEQKLPVEAAAKPRPRKSPVKKAVAKPVRASRKKVVAAKPVVSTKTVAKKTAARKTAPTQAGGSKVVSMKDWVARYASANTADAAGKRKEDRKNKARK